MGTNEKQIPINLWDEDDRPREKLMKQGRRALSAAELIAILIGSGNKDESAVDLAKRILHAYKHDLNELAKSGLADLSKFKGIGEAKAITIIAALELGRRRKDEPEKAINKVHGSRQVYDFLKHRFADLNYEEFWILLLNRSNRIIGDLLISKGGQAGTVADPKIIFKSALEGSAASIILCHNHPSGNPKPSASDIELTKKLLQSGKLLDLPVLDHIIFTDSSYFSFSDENLL